MDSPDEVVTRAQSAGVSQMICVGTDLETSKGAIDAANQYEEVVATVGLHPHDASQFESNRDELEALARTPGVRGIGEAGFDFHYMHSTKDEQEQAFRWQIGLAKELDVALVIHSRSAWDDTFRVLEDVGLPKFTVFHCFTGGPTEAGRAIEMGAFVSFSGIVTFPNADDVRSAVRSVPSDRLLIETDAPFLTPVPHRGKTNEPAFVGLVGSAVAQASGRSEIEVADSVRITTAQVFGVH